MELFVPGVNARLLKFVVDTLPLKVSVVCWTESMVALHWVKGQSSWKPFVANRVAEIQSTWDPDFWRYHAIKEIPADMFTSGVNGANMTTSTLWWNGPQ